MSHDYKYKARCVNVVDGDTIDCEVDLGFHAFVKMRFRLSRIDASELNAKDDAERAKAKYTKEFVLKEILNEELEIVSTKTEKFGRYLAEVFYKNDLGVNLNLNQVLLDQGLAKLYEKIKEKI